MNTMDSSGRSAGWSRGVFLVALLLAMAAGCAVPTEPKAPSWEVEYNIPLLDQWIDLIDLMDEDAFSDFGGDSLVFVEFDESLDPIGIGNEVSITGLSQTVATSMGNFTVPAIPGQSVSISLALLLGGQLPPSVRSP